MKYICFYCNRSIIGNKLTPQGLSGTHICTYCETIYSLIQDHLFCFEFKLNNDLTANVTVTDDKMIRIYKNVSGAQYHVLITKFPVTPDFYLIPLPQLKDKIIKIIPFL